MISIHVPAWGTTHYVGAEYHGYDYFNPRSRVGNDYMFGVDGKVQAISIHVPAWGTT